MFLAFSQRIGHYLLLLSLTSLLYLPGLGQPSLWDIDEGNNAEAAREMLERDNWIVPQFNYQLRVDKPALLYWLQLLAYRFCGINEFSARLPGAMASQLTVLLTYELGCLLFSPVAGLLGSVILASSLLFCGSAHFANPDPLLIACTVLTFLVFWYSARRGSSTWLIGVGLTMGIGFVAKGPVAVVLPAAAIGLFLLWSGQLRSLWRWQLPVGFLVWVLVAVPWFALVGSETKGEFLQGFFLKHNRDRFLSPMEGHYGSVFYHVVSLFLGFMPWSVFLAPAIWHGFKQLRATPTGGDTGSACQLVSLSPCRFLFCWIGVWFVFFTISGTKLPNYILPLYPAVALLTGNFLERWLRGDIVTARWVVPVSLGSLGLVGVALAAGLLVAGGLIELPIRRYNRFPGLEELAWMGVIPVIGAAVATWRLICNDRQGVIASVAGSAAVLAGALASFGAPAFDAFKAPRYLVETAGVRDPDHEIRIGSFDYFQPSLVFYCQREVTQLFNANQAKAFLQTPLPVYLFTSAAVWPELERQVPACKVLSRHWCFYRNCEVVVVSNR
jgi:4-amino-4-deoxy-L-arabinose transferase-like glycosyltransferase